jgi:hypothetical protein
MICIVINVAYGQGPLRCTVTCRKRERRPCPRSSVAVWTKRRRSVKDGMSLRQTVRSTHSCKLTESKLLSSSTVEYDVVGIKKFETTLIPYLLVSSVPSANQNSSWQQHPPTKWYVALSMTASSQHTTFASALITALSALAVVSILVFDGFEPAPYDHCRETIRNSVIFQLVGKLIWKPHTRCTRNQGRAMQNPVEEHMGVLLQCVN